MHLSTHTKDWQLPSEPAPSDPWPNGQLWPWSAEEAHQTPGADLSVLHAVCKVSEGRGSMASFFRPDTQTSDFRLRMNVLARMTKVSVPAGLAHKRPRADEEEGSPLEFKLSLVIRSQLYTHQTAVS